MITASHNPPKYNGLKISGRNAAPLDGANSLKQLKALIQVRPVPNRRREVLEPLDIETDYLSFLKPFKRHIKPLRIVADCSDGMAGYRIHQVRKDLPIELIVLNDRLDGNFPHHGPDPMDPEGIAELSRQVRERQTDLGMRFDGDGDRIVFVDDQGQLVSPGPIIELPGHHYFGHGPELPDQDRTVLYDIRSSRSVPEYLSDFGARPEICPIGHTQVKRMLRKTRGLYAGELTGHCFRKSEGFWKNE